MTPEQLLSIRKRGQRPDSLVVLSLVGRIVKLEVPVIEYHDGADLRGLRDLDVVIAASHTQRNLVDVIDKVVQLAPDVWWWDVATGEWITIRDRGDSWIRKVYPLWN